MMKTLLAVFAERIGKAVEAWMFLIMIRLPIIVCKIVLLTLYIVWIVQNVQMYKSVSEARFLFRFQVSKQ